MIRRVKACERDVLSLKSRTPVSSARQPETYRDKVVLKPWGHEFLFFQNEHVAAWYLHLRPGHATSMHCHPEKKTSLTILSGEALCGTFSDRMRLNGLESVIIEKGVFHSTKALSANGLRLIEIESPPRKTDLVRLNDAYGRQSHGYEGLAEMVSSGLDTYGHFYFDEPSARGRLTQTSDGCDITLTRYATQEHFDKHFRPRADEFICSCQGNVRDARGSLVLALGDMQIGAEFKNRRGLTIDRDLLLMSIAPRRPGA